MESSAAESVAMTDCCAEVVLAASRWLQSGYPLAIMLAIISISFLTRTKRNHIEENTMSKFQSVATGATILVAILSFPLIQNALAAIPSDSWQNIGYLVIVGAVGVTVYGFFIYMMVMMAIGLITKYTIKSIKGEQSTDKVIPGGTMVFAMDIHTRFSLLNGFLEIVVTNPYGDVSTTTAYVEQAEPRIKGLLRGKFHEVEYARWLIPNDAVPANMLPTYISVIYAEESSLSTKNSD